MVRFIRRWKWTLTVSVMAVAALTLLIAMHKWWALVFIALSAISAFVRARRNG